MLSAPKGSLGPSLWIRQPPSPTAQPGGRDRTWGRERNMPFTHDVALGISNKILPLGVVKTDHYVACGDSIRFNCSDLSFLEGKEESCVAAPLAGVLPKQQRCRHASTMRGALRPGPGLSPNEPGREASFQAAFSHALLLVTRGPNLAPLHPTRGGSWPQDKQLKIIFSHLVNTLPHWR